MSDHSDLPSGNRLDSWKEIAAFLGRAERTVKRWETERGLPVRRVPGGGRSAVFAYTHELEEWLKGKGEELAAEDSSSTEGPSRTGVPQVSPTLRDMGSTTPPRLPRSRLFAWLVPLTLVGALIAYFSLGHSAIHIKASASRHIPSAEAQDLYLKGRYFWERRTPDDINKALDYFTQAVVKDPSDAQAYIGLADCYNLLREFGSMPPNEAYPRALSAAQRAVELDDTSAEAHLSLAFGTYWWSWHALTAEREFKRALELDPNLMRAHYWYATFLWVRGQTTECFDQLEQARRLEPSSAAILADKAYFQWLAGHTEEAVEQLTQLASTQPSLSSPHSYLAQVYWTRKDYAKSLAESRRMAVLRHDQDGLALADAREKGFAAGGLKGMYESELPLQKEMVDRGAGTAYALAQTYAALGKRQEALAYLQISFDRHEAAMLVGDPIPELQNDPEFQKFRAEVDQRLTQ